jgi:hypothetical protein
MDKCLANDAGWYPDKNMPAKDLSEDVNSLVDAKGQKALVQAVKAAEYTKMPEHPQPPLKM